MFILSRSKYRILGSISVRFSSILRKKTLLSIPKQKLVLKYNIDGNTENKVQRSKLLINQKLLNLYLTPLKLSLTVKLFPKRKILNKLLPKKGNKRRKPKNLKDKITAKIEVEAVCLSAKTVLSPIELSKNSKTPTKRMINFYILSKNAILFLAKKKSR